MELIYERALNIFTCKASVAANKTDAYSSVRLNGQSLVILLDFQFG